MRQIKGFTLIEILAVVFIIGIMATAATVVFSSGGAKTDLDDSVEKFVKYAHRVADLAILNGEPVGLVMTPPPWSGLAAEEQAWGYTWKRYVEVPTEGGLVPQWLDIEGLPAVTLDPSIRLFVRIEDDEWEWQANPPSEQPIFVQHPSGEAEPYLFAVEFTHDDSSLVPQNVDISESGRLQWREKVAEFELLEERLR